MAEVLASALSGEYFPRINKVQAQQIVAKIEFVDKSGYYEEFETKRFIYGTI